MAHFNFRYLRSVQKWISGRISQVSESLESRLRSRKWTAIALLALASLLGKVAHHVTQREAILQWERAHSPSERVVRFTLGSRGMRLITDVSLLQKLLRSISIQLDQEGSTWLDSEANWIAYYANKENSVEPQFFCVQCSSLPHQWKPMGIGWGGLEIALEAVDQKMASMRPVPRIQSAQGFRDSREIIY